jgi:glycine C-acetyltransferase
VPQGKARLRAIVTAAHKRKDLEKAIEVIGRVGRQMGIAQA